MRMVSRLYHCFLKLKEHGVIKRLIQNSVPLETALGKGRHDILYVTNHHGGGTKSYEENFLCGKKAFVFRRLGYSEEKDRYYLIAAAGSHRFSIIEKEDVDSLLKYDFDEIIVSTLIDYDYEDIKYFQETLTKYRDKTNCRLSYLVHDFHCVCPNCNLFVNGRYYPPDDPEMPKSYLVKGRETDLSAWQEMWLEFLSQCDEIRCFSESSRKILQAAYPQLDSGLITVVPHDMSYCRNTPIQGVDSLPFHLGVVGACFADFKGRRVVRKLIQRYGNVVPITLVGSQWWRFLLFRRKVKYLGPYRRDDLQKIIEQRKISSVLFPSLCPETFSYLVSELILMDIPVLCFDYGAQAEKIKAYEKGVLLNGEDDLWNYIGGKQ